MLKEIYAKVNKQLSIEEQAKQMRELMKNENIGKYKEAPIEWITHKIETGEIKIL